MRPSAIGSLSPAGLVIGMAVLVMSFSACGGDSAGGAAEPATHTLYLEAIEPKGTTNVEKEPVPEETLPEGGGYAMEEPDAEGNWVVETYKWSADQVVVTEGDTVNLEILGVNGALHEGKIESHADTFTVERGKLTSLSFEAGAPGVYKIICTLHQPAMTSELVVLPRE